MLNPRNVRTPWKCLGPNCFLRAGLFSETPFLEPPIDGRTLKCCKPPDAVVLCCLCPALLSPDQIRVV